MHPIYIVIKISENTAPVYGLFMDTLFPNKALLEHTQHAPKVDGETSHT